ncbi:hypothetical protein [Micromonospora sp. NPDC006431]|uniref:hypothetical protein n=1 Tax=Micromonospora sp. NPDC006431 TaxID=3364235 RepID=UPI00369BE9A1
MASLHIRPARQRSLGAPTRPLRGRYEKGRLVVIKQMHEVLGAPHRHLPRHAAVIAGIVIVGRSRRHVAAGTVAPPSHPLVAGRASTDERSTWSWFLRPAGPP